MGCFVVTTVEALAVTAVKHARKRNIKKKGIDIKADKSFANDKRLSWLSFMTWGGSLLLLIEHIWHGEIVPWFPFFTAMKTKEGTIELLTEMSTVGVSMALLVTVVWAVAALISYKKEVRKAVIE